MFMGRYNHTIDPKGRLSIPSRYREVLGDEFVVSRGMDGCLFVYGIDDWKVFEAKLASLPLINAEARQFARFFLSGAQYVSVDKQGRILLPQDLREFAHLDRDVVLAGMGFFLSFFLSLSLFFLPSYLKKFFLSLGRYFSQ